MENLNILFTHSYFLRFDPKQWKLGQPYAPLGTLYAAALLRSKGFNIQFHDSMFANAASDLLKPLRKHQPGILVIYDDGFNYLTKMCLTNMRHAAFEMIQLAKAQGCVVIVSSSDATDHAEKYLEHGADFIVVGEGEQTVLELVQVIQEQAGDVTSIAGIVYKLSGGILRTIKRPVLKDLDALPVPAWDLINWQPYRQMWLKSAGYFSVNIATTRGCPYKCNWCAKPIYGNRYNSRSPQHVIAEIKFLQFLVAFEHIWFCDDIFGLKPGWVVEFAELLTKENISVRFKIQSRADLLLQENYVTALSKAGCETVWMGAESGSQKVLDAMDKCITVQQISEATNLLRKHHIKPCFFIQFGYLGETNEDINATIQMIHRLMPDQLGISVSYPLPGTTFYEKVKAQLQAKANWTDSDELALLFTNNQTAPFYRQLHRYVHQSYRQRKSRQQLVRLLHQPGEINLRSILKAGSLLYYAPSSFWQKVKLRQLQNWAG